MMRLPNLEIFRAAGLGESQIFTMVEKPGLLRVRDLEQAFFLLKTSHGSFFQTVILKQTKDTTFNSSSSERRPSTGLNWSETPEQSYMD